MLYIWRNYEFTVERSSTFRVVALISSFSISYIIESCSFHLRQVKVFKSTIRLAYVCQSNKLRLVLQHMNVITRINLLCLCNRLDKTSRLQASISNSCLCMAMPSHIGASTTIRLAQPSKFDLLTQLANLAVVKQQLESFLDKSMQSDYLDYVYLLL